MTHQGVSIGCTDWIPASGRSYGLAGPCGPQIQRAWHFPPTLPTCSPPKNCYAAPESNRAEQLNPEQRTGIQRQASTWTAFAADSRTSMSQHKTAKASIVTSSCAPSMISQGSRKSRRPPRPVPTAAFSEGAPDLQCCRLES